jgi:hypothetical protein
MGMKTLFLFILLSVVSYTAIATDNLEDGYLGSGKVLRYSINKHGEQNHRKEILEELPTREALKLREAELVNKDLLAHPLNMNLKFGGEGGWEFINGTGKNIRDDFVRDEAYRKKMSKAKNGQKYNLSESQRQNLINNNVMKRPEVAAKVASALTGTKKSVEHKMKIATAIKKWHQEKNKRD